MVRGQTTIDFTLGVVVFIVAILFVFTFVPGILSPFELGGSEDPALSDRVADSLAQGTLGSPETPHSLDRYCTVAFFNDSRSTSPADCRYSGEALEQRLNLDTTQRVNVTLNADRDGDGETELLCWQSEDALDGADLKEAGNCGGGSPVTLAAGDEVPSDTASTVTARRVVSLHGQTVMMEVVVW
jgi:hypothetical protein